MLYVFFRRLEENNYVVYMDNCTLLLNRKKDYVHCSLKRYKKLLHLKRHHLVHIWTTIGPKCHPINVILVHISLKVPRIGIKCQRYSGFSQGMYTFNYSRNEVAVCSVSCVETLVLTKRRRFSSFLVQIQLATPTLS